MNYNIQSYDFGAASFNMLGRFVQGISGVTIDTTQEASWRYGANNKPMSVPKTAARIFWNPILAKINQNLLHQ